MNHQQQTKHFGPIANSFLNWAGSKRRASKYLLRYELPAFRNYHEPFLGSGAFFFALSSLYKIPKAILSDCNEHLASTFCGVKEDPEGVVRSLKLHMLLDSDVHFAGVLRQLNDQTGTVSCRSDHAANVIYALTQSFHSAWYETPEGKISLSRRTQPKPFKPHFDRVRLASERLANADIQAREFAESMDLVSSDDLVFIDPPYLEERTFTDRRAYTAKRFSAHDLEVLFELIEEAVCRGAHVIFCWNRKLHRSEFEAGRWLTVGQDSVWASFM